MACPVCGSSNTQAMGSSPTHDYYKCLNCGNEYTERK